jgi:hypothetical protein
MTHFKLAVLSFVMLTMAAHGQGNLEGRGKARRFVSEKYGLSMFIPTGWRVELPVDRLLAYSYPATRALPQGQLPNGGASIVVIMRKPLSEERRYGRTLPEWAAKDMEIEADGNPASPSAFQMPQESGTQDAISLSYDSAILGIGQQQQHEVAIYWEFKGSFFAAHLFYIAGDPKGTALEKLFLDTVRSFRPLPSHR